jgi:DNA-binding protein HU-beta
LLGRFSYDPKFFARLNRQNSKTLLVRANKTRSCPVQPSYYYGNATTAAASQSFFKMTKAELQSALAAAAQTDKKTAGVFLDTLSDIAYKATKKNGEFVVPGFGKLVKQKRKARTGINPSTKQKIKIPAKTVLKFRVAKVAKDAILGMKK